MALQWLRRHQKRVLVPLVAVVIVTFVFLWGGGGRTGRDVGDFGWIKIGNETIGGRELAEYHRALLVIARGVPGVSVGEMTHVIYLMRAKLAERAGVSVSAEQVREAIRAIMSAPTLLGTKDFTNADYRARLRELNVLPASFEEFVSRFIAAETLRNAMADAGYLTTEELRLAFRREKDRIRLRVRDFNVADFEKDVTPPTDEEIDKYYREHKGLPLGDDLALATEPEVSVEYAFVERAGAEALAKTLRRADAGVRLEGLLGGPEAGLAGRLAAVGLGADLEARLLDRYERDKPRYRIPPPAPKKAPEKGQGGPPPAPDAPQVIETPGTPETPDGGGEGAAGAQGGMGVFAAVAPPALGAAAPGEAALPVEAEAPGAPEEGGAPEEPGEAAPAEPAAGEAPAAEAEAPPPEELFRPLAEVRGQVLSHVESDMARDAASRRARRVVDFAGEHSRLRPVGADALLAGLALGCAPALAGASATADRFEILRACEEAGALHGVTPLAKPDALKSVPLLGTFGNVPESAASRAASGAGDEWSWPSTVGKGSVVWRVADHVPPRLLTPEEAKEKVRKRIVHERAAGLAAKAAEAFRRKLQAGEAQASEMTLTPALGAGDAKARPFAALGLGEVAPEAVAIGEKDDSEVRVDLDRRANDLAEALAEAGLETDVREVAERLAEETRAENTARYRVAVPAERLEPRLEEYVKWREGRMPDIHARVREAFMLEVWGDVAMDEAKYQESPEFGERRARTRRQR